MNRFIVDGKLIDTPEVKVIGSGARQGKVTNFKILNTEGSGDKAIETTIWCEAWSDAGAVIKNFRKDDYITIDGKLLENSWEDKDTGKRRSLLKMRVQGCSAYTGPNVVVVENNEGGSVQSAPQPAVQQAAQQAPPPANNSAQIPF